MKKIVSVLQSSRNGRNNVHDSPIVTPLTRYSTIRRIDGPIISGDITITETSSIGSSRNPNVDTELVPGARRVRRFSKPRVIQGQLDGVDGIIVQEDEFEGLTSLGESSRESGASSASSLPASVPASLRSSRSSSGGSSKSSDSKKKKHSKHKKGRRKHKDSSSSKRSSSSSASSSGSSMGNSGLTSLSNQAASEASYLRDSDSEAGITDLYDEPESDSGDEGLASLQSDSDSDDDSDASSATPTPTNLGTLSEVEDSSDSESEDDAPVSAQKPDSEVGSEVESDVEVSESEQSDSEDDSVVRPESLQGKRNSKSSTISKKSVKSSSSKRSSKSSSSSKKSKRDSVESKQSKTSSVADDDTKSESSESAAQEEPVTPIKSKKSKSKKSKSSSKKSKKKSKKSRRSRKKKRSSEKVRRKSRSHSPVAISEASDSDSVDESSSSEVDDIVETQSLPSNDEMQTRKEKEFGTSGLQRPSLTTETSRTSVTSIGIMSYSHNKWQRNSLGKWSLSNESSVSMDRPVISKTLPTIVAKSHEEHQDAELWAGMPKPKPHQSSAPWIGITQTPKPSHTRTKTAEPLHHREFLGTPFVSAATYKAAIRGKSSKSTGLHRSKSSQSSSSRGRSSGKSRSGLSRSSSTPASSRSARHRTRGNHRRVPSSVKEEDEAAESDNDRDIPLTPSQVKKQQKRLKARMDQSREGKPHVHKREQPLFDRSREVFRSIGREERQVRQSSLTKYRNGTSRVSRKDSNGSTASSSKSGKRRSSKENRSSRTSGTGPVAPHLHVNTPNRWLRTASGRWDTGAGSSKLFATPPTSPIVPSSSSRGSQLPVDMTAVKFKGGFDSNSKMTTRVSVKLTKSIAAAKTSRSRIGSTSSRSRHARKPSNGAGRTVRTASGVAQDTPETSTSAVLRSLPNLWSRSNVMLYSSNPHCDANSDEGNGDIAETSNSKPTQYLKAAYSKLRGSPPAGGRKSMATSVSSSSSISTDSRTTVSRSLSEARKSLFRKKPGFYQGSIFTNGGRRNETGGGCADIIRGGHNGSSLSSSLSPYKSSSFAQKIIAAQQREAGSVKPVPLNG